MGKILVIEDDLFSRDMLKDILNKAGHEVETAANGREGLDLLSRLPETEVVVSDVVMPEIDGLGVLAEIKAHAPTLPVILLTSRESESTMLQAIRLGVFDFQKKPVSIVEFVLAVDRASAHHRLLRDQKVKLERLAVLESGARQLTDLVCEEFPLELMTEEYDILQGIVRLITEVLACERSSVLIMDPRDQWLRVAVSVGLDEGLISEENRPAKNSVSSFVIETGRPLLVKDIQNDPRVDEAAFSSQYKTRSCVIAPLKIRNRMIGTVTANDKKGGETFTEDDLYFLSTMSSHASSTLARAIHLTELRRDRQRLSNQTEILRILIHCLEPEEMLDNLLLKCQEIIGAANVSLFLMDEKQKELVRTVGFNAGTKITKPHAIPIGLSITGKSAELGRAFTLNQPDHSSDYIPDLEWKGKGRVRNIMVIPLSASGATLGVLRLLNKKDGDFSHADLTLLEELAASLSVAIRNMKLHERLSDSIEAQIESNRALQKLNDEFILQSGELSKMRKKLAGVG